MRYLNICLASVLIVCAACTAYAIYCWRECQPLPPRVVVRHNTCRLVMIVPVQPSNRSQPTQTQNLSQPVFVTCVGDCRVDTINESVCGRAPLHLPCHDCLNDPAGAVPIEITTGCKFMITPNAAFCFCGDQTNPGVGVGHGCVARVCPVWPC